ncbi:MAG TPA: D-TA family PLP-dependent enzyme [Verrucomicrobiae bacterium]|nr:D-TA family PLP-dependent enzyme [Verrucomicrobiae bacterium]
MQSDWYRVENVEEVPSPSLLIYLARVEANLDRMIAIAGDPARLRPHVKTHKLAELVALQTARGITKFKCATIAEAEMLGQARAPDVLLAYQPVGPNVKRFLALIRAFPFTRFSALVDDPQAARAVSEAASAAGLQVELLVDLDIGQHRTGIPASPGAEALYRLISSLPGLHAGGLHAYDGHIGDTDLVKRTAACEAAFAPVERLRIALTQTGFPVPRLIVGGTPTFPIHARRSGVELSPGTCVFWDAGYATKLPDMDFQPAAVVLTRVVSKPEPTRLCLDLGHKALASEMPQPRAQLIGLPDAKLVMHSEEHLVVETARAGEFEVGDCFYAIPWHVCPTVALHSEAWVIENGRAARRWRVTARERTLSI